MIKKLKQKFILINMLFVGVVVLFIFIALCVLTYRTEKEQINETLENIIFFDKRTDKPSVEHGIPNIGSTEELPYTYAFYVTVNEYGRIVSSNGFGTGMEEEALSAAVERVLATTEESGIISDMGLMYMQRTSPFGISIAFASIEHLKTTVKNTAVIAGIACAFSLLIFYFLSRFLANLSIKPIEAAWKSQRQFVADASHDLKTPLTVILANTGILRAHREEDVESQIKWVESTEEEAQRMRALVDKMLELAKSEDMKEKLILGELDISELTERVCLQFEPVAFEKGVEIESNITEGIKMQTNEDAFVRLIHILVDNAIKYGESGKKAKITLSQTKQTVRLSVKNDGNIISDEDLPHIFERFYRADKARSVGGHGLGLSIAKNLTESLGGKITAESSVQNGTVFTVVFKI